MIKAVFSDMDGTIMRNRTISEEDVRAINEMNANGIHFIITTGRFMASIVMDMNRYGIWCDRITSNGSAVTIGHEVHLLGTVDPYVFEEVFHKVTEKYPYLYSNFVLNEKDNFRYNTMEEVNYTNDAYLQKMSEHPEGMNKFQIRFATKEEMDGAREIVRSISDTIEGHSSSPLNADYSAAGVNKGAAIRFVCDYFGISYDETAGIGDGENDITIMDNTSLNFAMKESEKELFNHCQYVVGSIAEAYEIIKKYNQENN